MANFFFIFLGLFFFFSLDGREIGVVTTAAYIGDREVAWRIKIAGERLGWKVTVDESEGYNTYHSKLDWVICMLPNNQLTNPHCPSYLLVFHPHNFLNKKREFLPFYEKYEGYLLTIHDRDSLEKGLKKSNKEFHAIPFYPTVFEVPYRKVDPKELVVMIPVWGNRFKDPNFRALYKLLSQSGFTKFYGPNPNKQLVSSGYMGAIPFDGVSVINVLQKHGVVLVLHSDIHNAEGIPSSRIFEAAAASCVIISDENAFVREHFGDSVFYVDTSLPAECIFEKIQEYIDIISLDPDFALEKAKKAHQIFMKKFTMENQLRNLDQMHQNLKN